MKIPSATVNLLFYIDMKKPTGAFFATFCSESTKYGVISIVNCYAA
jgi:hypothetical protein